MPPEPSEIVRFWLNGAHRAGYLVRRIERGKDAGKLEVRLGGRLVIVAPEQLIIRKEVPDGDVPRVRRR